MADSTKVKRIKVNGIDCDINFTPIGHITSPNGIDYTLKVDDYGNLYTVDESNLPTEFDPDSQTAKLSVPKFYINSFYCGGKDSDEHTLNYCSHNFVELSNLTNADINLKNVTLQYSISSTEWQVLPLEGVIKAGSTFLIRGAQCSMINSPTTKIVVDSYDMEWFITDAATGKKELIKFDDSQGKFYLAINLSAYQGANPYDKTNLDVAQNAIGYIDLVGVNADGYENNPYTADGGLKKSRLFKKYYSMDPVKQATKAIDARDNSKDWNFVDLTKSDGEIIPSIKVYTPKASWEGKNTFYDKTELLEHKPTIITCSFGIQATDGGENERATRCFNWLTKDPDNKYIWIRPQGQNDWGEAHESFCDGDGRAEYATEKERKVYDRIMKEYTNNVVIIANKYIQKGFSAGTYEYIAGSKNNDGTPCFENCTEIRSFTVRTSDSVNNGFKFLQTTDQQGFNWSEYRIWEAAAKCIDKESGGTYDFMINTGDMTQNGNRIGEWVDYFNGKSVAMKNMEEMATIGNNDLSLNVLYLIGNGDDNNKLWHENITFFFTFELDVDNFPEFTGATSEKYIIPSLYSFNYGNAHFLCVNTEIKKETESAPYGYNFGDNVYGKFYPQIKTWCENDYNKYCSNTSWNIAFCHEMPFTILTPSITETTTSVITERPGSNANTNTPLNLQYWLSEFFQTHNYPLVFGGHKHTQATSWPILENVNYENGERTVNSMHPIIVVSNDPESIYYIGKYYVLTQGETGATDLVEYTYTYTVKVGEQTVEKQFTGKYPNTWFNGATLKTEYTNAVQMCVFEWEDNISGNTPVTYAMSQATSYKHTSNKELPGQNIPWLKYYFERKAHGAKKDTPAAEQKFPFYTIWEIGNSEIIGNVRKAYGEFNSSGTFDINIDWPYVKNGYSAAEKDNLTKIHSINGITKMSNLAAETDTRTIIVKK